MSISICYSKILDPISKMTNILYHGSCRCSQMKSSTWANYPVNLLNFDQIWCKRHNLKTFKTITNLRFRFSKFLNIETEVDIFFSVVVKINLKKRKKSWLSMLMLSGVGSLETRINPRFEQITDEIQQQGILLNGWWNKLALTRTFLWRVRALGWTSS